MTPGSKTIVEACIGSLSDALLAASLGADRLEFCSALDVGGLTPDFDELRRLRDAVDVPIVAMVRPRSGDFSYSESEWAAMLGDAEKVLSLGADGVVFGVLTKDRTVDAARVLEMTAVVRKHSNKEIVFHRALDEARNLNESYALLAVLNLDRILTSGGAATAVEGAAAIGRLVTARATAGKPEIIAGGGVRSDNAVEILRRTGIRQLHSACGTGIAPIRLDPDKLRRLLAAVRQFDERSSDRWRKEPEN